MPKGYRSRLKQILSDIEIEQGERFLQRSLAKEAGVTPGTFSAWMNHVKVNRMLNIDTWFSIAEALNVHPMDLISLVGVDWLDEEEETPEGKTPLLANYVIDSQEAGQILVPTN